MHNSNIYSYMNNNFITILYYPIEKNSKIIYNPIVDTEILNTVHRIFSKYLRESRTISKAYNFFIIA